MEKAKKEGLSDVELAPSQSIVAGHVTTQDAVFGEISEDGPNYRSVRSHSRPRKQTPDFWTF